MPDTPLNPDARRAAFEAVQAIDGPASIGTMEVVDVAVSAYLAVAEPEVNSVEELKALPIGSVILDGGGDAGIIEPGAILFTETNPLSPEYVAKHYLPARVLYRPTKEPRDGC